MNEDKEFDFFERKTYQEVTIWDWLGRLIPLSVLAVIAVCYFLEYHDWLDLVIQFSSIGFLIFCFIWWYWAIFKIAKTVKYLRQSQKNFYDLLNEFRQLKRAVKTTDTNEEQK